MEPQKPFACTIPDCGLTFTNEDHLNVHVKKHDMVLQLGAEQKAAFVADQTPTPTRFIRNCEEVGLFQDLQNVNPFDEGFKRAMETKACILSLDGALVGSTSDDVLHTPQMTFPHLPDAGDTALFNHHRNINVSRSSSDESGAVKEYETTTISKLTNEVTTISRIVEKDPITNEDHNGGKETVSYTNNVIQIHSNVEIRKDQGHSDIVKPVALVEVYTDSVIKDTNVVTKDVMLTDSNKLQIPDKLPIMSQKSIDYVVDSLTNGTCSETRDLDREKESLIMLKNNLAKKPGGPEQQPCRSVIQLNEAIRASDELKRQKAVANVNLDEDYEVIIRLPNKKTIRMKAVEEVYEKNAIKNETKQKLKEALTSKAEKVQVKQENQIPVIKKVQNIENSRLIPNIVALYPVTLVNPAQTSVLLTNTLQKIPIPAVNPFRNAAKTGQYSKKAALKRVCSSKTQNEGSCRKIKVNKNADVNKAVEEESNNQDWSINNVERLKESSNLETREADQSNENEANKDGIENGSFGDKSTFARHFLERRSAASRRYRERLKNTMQSQKSENQQLKEQNQRLRAANQALKSLLTKHLTRCPCPEDLQSLRDVV